MTKIVINRGTGFDLSHVAIMRYAELKGILLSAYRYDNSIKLFVKVDMATYDSARSPDYFIGCENTVSCTREIMNELLFHESFLPRDDPFLVQVVEELGDDANTIMSELKVVEIPDDVDWYIDEDEMVARGIKEQPKMCAWSRIGRLTSD